MHSRTVINLAARCSDNVLKSEDRSIMQAFLPKHTAPVAEPAADARNLLVQSFSYEGRRVILPALADAMTHCGCWLLERKAVSVTQLDFIFEVQQRAVLDLYSALIGAGLELTRGSHLELTGLCGLLAHSSTTASRRQVVHVTLEVSFLEELDLKSILTPGAALA
jgi:hypothetical protein